MDATITLWCRAPGSLADMQLVFCWNGHRDESGNARSILSYVEEHAVRLRDAYLAWVHELGECCVKGKRLVDHLAQEDGLSYWWMTPLVEKSTAKSPIGDALRLLALEEIVARHNPHRLVLESTHQVLDESIRPWCKTLAIDYAWTCPPAASWRMPTLKSRLEKLPHCVLALGSLARYVLRRWPMRRTEGVPWPSERPAVFFCSYLFNLDARRAQNGHFHSRYWDGLHALMKQMGLRGNWLQIYVAHDAVPDPASANACVDGFNRHDSEQGMHAMLDAYLSWPVIRSVLVAWLRLNLVAWRLRAIQPAFGRGQSRLSFWPLMRNDWALSLRGKLSVSNLMSIALFDEAVRDLPRQDMGLYLCENQTWERALCHAWHKHGHGRLVAVPHSTVRFWDLRYFSDRRTVLSTSIHAMPQADLVALNGRAAMDAYASVGFPPMRIVECEALRYGHLNAPRPTRAAPAEQDIALKVLVLGDYLPVATEQLLTLLVAAAPRVARSVRYTIKAHPNYPVMAEDYPTLGLGVITQALGDILPDYDIAFASNLTSAAVDAYLAGLPVLVLSDPAELNQSPLRGWDSVQFVTTATEFANALEAASPGQRTQAQRTDFFFLDPDLPRWRALLRAKDGAIQSRVDCDGSAAEIRSHRQADVAGIF